MTKHPTEHADFAILSMTQLKTLWQSVMQGAWQELIIILALAAVAALFSFLCNRAIDKISWKNWFTGTIDFLAPLLTPLFALIFLSLSSGVFSYLESEQFLIPLATKLAIAWCAIHLVMLMNSRKTAGLFIALVIIPITLLQLFGVWKPITTELKHWRMTVGTVDITAYAAIKSIAAVIVLFWFASFITNLMDGRLKRIKSLRASNRVLIMKIFQILLYFVVFILLMQILGISLTALSVFGGALGVGLGFGLQKIASNFISGIILLFEKSMQVDDIIELQDGTFGTIKHTGARYTLIETPEGKEVLVPNEDFITQRMVNWTYSSKKARVEINVGVAYGTDMKLARSLMLQAASSHQSCIVDPTPQCYLTEFADSGITLMLHFWINDINDGRLAPKSDVMLSILESFSAHNISIPFPQREVRVFHRYEDAASPSDKELVSLL